MRERRLTTDLYECLDDDNTLYLRERAGRRWWICYLPDGSRYIPLAQRRSWDEMFGAAR